MDSESKVTARISRDLYEKVQENFHHGQTTKLFRQIFLSIETLIEDEKFNDVLDYMYRGKELTLPGLKERK